MLKFINSEFYKIIHRKCTYVFVIIFLGSAFFFNGILKIAMPVTDKVPTGDILDFWEQLVLIFGWFIVFMIAQIVHSNESKAGVLKNSISFGLNRATVYIGRFLAQFILLLLAVAVIGGMVILGTFVFFGPIPVTTLMAFIRHIGLLFILWTAALAMANCMLMNFPSGSLATVSYILYFVLVEQLISIAAELLPDNHIVMFLVDNEIFCLALRAFIGESPEGLSTEFCVVGIVYFILFFFGGLFLFRRKEVK